MSLALAQLPSPPETKAQPPDVGFQLQTDSGKTKFQIGEVIPLKLSFTSSTPKKYQINIATSDRSGRMKICRRAKHRSRPGRIPCPS
jgi:hypothetical protein